MFSSLTILDSILLYLLRMDYGMGPKVVTLPTYLCKNSSIFY